MDKVKTLFDVLQEGFADIAGISHCSAFPKRRDDIRLPAVLIDLVEIEPGRDPGTGVLGHSLLRRRSRASCRHGLWHPSHRSKWAGGSGVIGLHFGFLDVLALVVAEGIVDADAPVSLEAVSPHELSHYVDQEQEC